MPDGVNPVFARDLRAGLVGKFAYLLRFSYVAVIGTELLLLAILLLQPDISEESVQGWFTAWANLHMLLLITVGAWLGGRSIAPEREQQTLPQLLTTPLTAPTIVYGKMMAVMVHTFYVFVMGVPLALFLPGLKLIPWAMALCFIALEMVYGACAAAWGLFCSVHGYTVRRALGLALGGVLILMMANVLLTPFIDFADVYALPLFPFKIMQIALNSGIASNGYNAGYAGSPMPSHTPYLVLETLCLYAVSTLLLLFLTARAFKHYAQTL
ncbi:MAG: ABC transporter permease subunit [Abitibacteriaceae bacterium]|nr:ABC transporter permease subunit [Abditibacteriaceae bacterium]